MSFLQKNINFQNGFSSMIKAVIFDWGGVYIDEPMQELVRYCSSKLGVDEQTFTQSFKKHEPKFKKGLVSEKDFWVKLCAELKVEPIPELWGQAVESVFRFRPEIRELIEELRKNYVTALLTNTEAPAMRYLRENGHDAPFDYVIASNEEGVMKPEKRIYEHALEKLGLRAQEVIFIDDNPEFVTGAQKIGIAVIQFENYEQLIKDLQSHGIKLRAG